jgi:hypothetical protein
MRKFTVLLVSIFALGALAAAQMEPKPIVAGTTEFFLGYAYQHADLSGSYAGTQNNVTETSTSLNGFAFEFSQYLHPSGLGFTIDLAHGSQKSVDSTGIKCTRSSYLVGPSYRLHQHGFFTPSVHVLAGVDHSDFTVNQGNIGVHYDFSNTDFAAAGGFALDGNLSRHLAVRLGQVDYLYSHHYGTNQSSFRYVGGVVLRF